MGLLDSISSLLGGKVDVQSRFEIQREAVSGTMSQFYKARDRRTDKIVGLKVLDREKTKFLESRFKGLKKPTEGQIAKSLDHPYIVKTFEHGLTNKGEQYLLMEFLEGPGVNSLLIGRSEKLNGRRLKLIRQMAEAIQGVHRAGYIHRDICPRNLVASPDCESLKLIDFGLTVPATPEFMQPGNRTGTPNYMAPELVKRLKTDQRLDVFSFGVSAFEILTFELPWARGATGQAAMSHSEPPADIVKYRPRIHPVLAKAVRQCLEPDPRNRMPSMDQFLQAIRKVEHEDQ